MRAGSMFISSSRESVPKSRPGGENIKMDMVVAGAITPVPLPARILASQAIERSVKQRAIDQRAHDQTTTAPIMINIIFRTIVLEP